MKKYEPENYNPDDIPMGYGEGSPFNIIGEIYAVYGAALTLRDYPPDVVASIWGVHVQAEAGPESQVQSLDEAVSIIRQLKRLDKVDDYLHGLARENKKTNQRTQLNSVRGRLRAISEEQSFHAGRLVKQSSRNPISPSHEGKRY